MQAKIYHALHHGNSPANGKYLREDKYYGVALDLAVEQSLAALPAPIPFLCEYIEKSGLYIEGLFRIAGNKTKIDAIIEAFKHENKVVLEDVHDATGALKAFFRQMPEPLIPFPHYEGFVAVGEMDGEKQKILLQAMITTLPRNHVNLLRYLMLFLHRIAQRADVNMMSEGNLAIVFGPNLLRPEVEDVSLTHKHTGLISKVVSGMISHAKDVFPPEEVRPEVLELTEKCAKVEAERAKLLMERGSFLDDWKKLSEERNVLRDDTVALTTERNKLQGELEGMHACLAASLAAVASVQRDKESHQKIQSEAAFELASCRHQVVTLREFVSTLEAQNQSESAKNMDLFTRLEFASAQVAALTSQLSTLQTEAKVQKEEHDKTLQVLMKEYSKVEEDKNSAVMTMEGALSKRSSGLPHRWQKRQCSLNASMLYWLSGDGDFNKSKAAMACVFLAEVVSVDDLPSSGMQAFTINTKTKTGVTGSFTFSAQTAQERDVWVSALRRNVNLLKSGMSRVK